MHGALQDLMGRAQREQGARSVGRCCVTTRGRQSRPTASCAEFGTIAANAKSQMKAKIVLLDSLRRKFDESPALVIPHQPTSADHDVPLINRQ